MPPFPTSAPYRIDQVTSAPLAMTALFLAAPLAAAFLTATTAHPWRRRAASALLLLTVTVFFTLASWGNSDTTKLSYFLAFHPPPVQGEPFWQLVAPLVVRLPYRMALMHGLVAGGYAAAALLLARQWRLPRWGGWWALLLVCSPLLRGFLQNAHSRQALAALFLLPLLLLAGRLARIDRRLAAGCALLATTMHTTFPVTLVLALLPRALGPQGGPVLPSGGSLRRWLPLGLTALAAAAVVLALAWPTMLLKLVDYLRPEGFFNSYSLAPAVGRLQLALLMGVAITVWQRRLGWRRLLADGASRQLAAFAALILLQQQCLQQGWLPQITSRFSDTLGFFLLIVWLAWLRRHRCVWACLPALLVTLDGWLFERLVASHNLACGRDDAFLCVPDRWPWQVQYPPPP